MQGIFLHILADALGSAATKAEGRQNMLCAYLSAGLLVGLGANALLGWWWADPVGALAMLPIILWQGWETLAEAREPADQED